MYQQVQDNILKFFDEKQNMHKANQIDDECNLYQI
jgi:hypothetical protein